MPYAFEPGDLDDPRGEREPVPADDAVIEAFEAWIGDCRQIEKREIGGSTSEVRYRLACDRLDGLDVRPPEATTLVLAYGESIPADVGLFLSAAYNHADAAVIFFDVDTAEPIGRLGYRLAEDKTLVIDADIASTMAVDASGLVVNRARIESYFGYSATGAFVNAPTGSCLTAGAGSARVFVDFGEVRGASSSTRPVRLGVGPPAGAGGRAVRLAPDEVSALADLDAFLADLRAGISGEREAVESYLGGLEPSPKRAIVTAIDRLLDEAGVQR